ncbi:hypothetical protein M7I_2183 [Glarea lozoyensis 74030]|uniref:Uncharacterized protein n=1 Tax=Glarea lozoyensis (strain ATCC 74030 / MF5533) TaxID=1104152 RepID=H0EI37_GLAL7|nr:hypothetical protein M7I_2183 [Glarea lozoyensis 74030]
MKSQFLCVPARMYRESAMLQLLGLHFSTTQLENLARS